MFEGYLGELRKLAEDAKDTISGGRADKKTDADFSSKQMAMGQKVEREHTTDPKKAREISRDHLEEFPDYYSRLHKMEAKAEKEKKAGADDTYYCPPCGWRGKGSELKNGKCPKCGAAVELVKKASDEGGRAPTKRDKASIREWLSRHDNAKDEDFHALAKKMGVNTHKAEAVAYDMAHELSKRGSMGQAGGMALYMRNRNRNKEDLPAAPRGRTMGEFLALLKRDRPVPVKQDVKTAADISSAERRRMLRKNPRLRHDDPNEELANVATEKLVRQGRMVDLRGAGPNSMERWAPATGMAAGSLAGTLPGLALISRGHTLSGAFVAGAGSGLGAGLGLAGGAGLQRLLNRRRLEEAASKTAAEGCPGGGKMRMGPRPGMGAKRGGGRGLGPGKGKQDRSGLKYIKDRLRDDPIKESHAQDLITAGDQIGRIMAKEAYARTLTGLAAGTVLGAGIGALTSEDSSNKGRARSAVIGGVAGGTLGGAIGAISEGAAAQMGEKFRQSGALNQAFQAGRADIAQEVVRGAGNKNVFQKGWQMGVSWARGGR